MDWNLKDCHQKAENTSRACKENVGQRPVGGGACRCAVRVGWVTVLGPSLGVLLAPG